jgi:hypothetical protein
MNNFKIDRLTNSIRNRVSGDCFATDISLVSKRDLKLISASRKWSFDWDFEYKSIERDVYKLTIVNNMNIIQGLLSLTVHEDHVFIHLLENAFFNRGKHRIYEGVAGNLVAFACKLSFLRGNEGFVAFHAKTSIIEHYKKSLGAVCIGNQLMILETKASTRLVEHYFKGEL